MTTFVAPVTKHALTLPDRIQTKHKLINIEETGGTWPHKSDEIGSSALSSKRYRDDNGEQYGRNVGSARALSVKLEENRILLEKESRKEIMLGRRLNRLIDI